ncbi:MAG TPA: hypothetical protein VHJ19_08600, partial [Gammaproteobacteria bacterium]|nr:hypothetical protein [Gammaproteobacteria bacterium]
DQRACNSADFTALLNRLRTGAKLTIMLMSLASVRELLGHGTLPKLISIIVNSAPVLSLLSNAVKSALLQAR